MRSRGHLATSGTARGLRRRPPRGHRPRPLRQLPEQARAAADLRADPDALGPRRGQRLRPPHDRRPAGHDRPPRRGPPKGFCCTPPSGTTRSPTSPPRSRRGRSAPRSTSRPWTRRATGRRTAPPDLRALPHQRSPSSGSALVYWDGGPVILRRRPRTGPRRRRTRTSRRARPSTARTRTATRATTSRAGRRRPHSSVDGRVPTTPARTMNHFVSPPMPIAFEPGARSPLLRERLPGTLGPWRSRVGFRPSPDAVPLALTASIRA